MINKIVEFFKNLINKLVLWLERLNLTEAFKWVESEGDISDNMERMMLARIVQGIKANGKATVTVAGDSIMHGFEPILKQEFGDKVFVAAIGGNRAKWIAEKPEHILSCASSDTLILHIGGNDLLSGETVEDTYNYIVDIINKVKHKFSKIYILEILPLGLLSDFPDARKVYTSNLDDVVNTITAVSTYKIPKINVLLNTVFSSGRQVEVLRVYDNLRKSDSSSWINPVYGLGDLIHVNEKAYREVYLPVIRRVVNA